MAHSIAGVISAAEFHGLEAFDTAARALAGGYSLVFMDHHYTKHWSRRLGVVGSLALPAGDPLLLPHDRVIGELLRRTTAAPAPFAIVWTEYFGGVGDQRAAAYEGESLLGCDGTINSALRQLGVQPGEHRDEFDALGLQHIRAMPMEVTRLWSAYDD